LNGEQRRGNEYADAKGESPQNCERMHVNTVKGIKIVFRDMAEH